MGDISEMMLDGTMCAGCGEFLGQGEGYPKFCKECQDEMDAVKRKPKKHKKRDKSNDKHSTRHQI